METHDERDARAGRPPRYTGADDAAPQPGSGMTAGRKVRIAVIAVIVVALLAVMLILHLTGVVGPGTNG
jgi:hypothetical protein